MLRALSTELWNGGRLMVPQASKVFDAKGKLTDDATRERLRKFLACFAAFIQGR